MPEITLLQKCKYALRVVTNAYDPEITRLIAAAKADLGFASVDDFASTADCIDAVEQAVITFVRLNFGEPTDYDRLKRSYDEQKAQLQLHLVNVETGDEN